MLQTFKLSQQFLPRSSMQEEIVTLKKWDKLIPCQLKNKEKCSQQLFQVRDKLKD